MASEDEIIDQRSNLQNGSETVLAIRLRNTVTANRRYPKTQGLDTGICVEFMENDGGLLYLLC